MSLTAALLLVLLGMSLGLSGVVRGEEPARSGQALTARKPPAPTPGQLAPSPEFVLYGVIIVDHHRSALLTEPRFTEGRIRRVVPGTQVGPYRVSRIEADGLLLEADGLALRVPLGGWDTVQGPAPGALAPLGGPDAPRAAARPGSTGGPPAARSGPAPVEAGGRPAPDAR